MKLPRKGISRVYIDPDTGEKHTAWLVHNPCNRVFPEHSKDPSADMFFEEHLHRALYFCSEHATKH